MRCGVRGKRPTFVFLTPIIEGAQAKKNVGELLKRKRRVKKLKGEEEGGYDLLDRRCSGPISDS